MKILTIPTAQHLARHWRSSPEEIRDELVKMARHPPIFNYNPLLAAARELLLLGIPEEQIIQGIKARETREGIQKYLLDVVPLLFDHFNVINPNFVTEVAHKHYPVGQNLTIPLRPTFIYGVNGRIYFPWFSFWRSNPLSGEQLSLFVTLVHEMLLRDPDLEDAKFEILDFSVTSKTQGRELRIINCAEIPKLEKSRLQEMLTIFMQGFEQAKQVLAEEASSRKSGRKDAGTFIDTNQIPLFD